MRRRAAFTLIEILIVITILAALTTFVVMAFRTDGPEKMRSAGRNAQSSILGARDRALHAKARRGLRVLRDPQNTNVGIGFAYVQPIDILTYPPNSFSLERVDLVAPTGGPNDADAPPVTIVRGVTGNDWSTLTDFLPAQPRIRIPAETGHWYTFTWDTAGPYALSATVPVLRLTTPFIDAGAVSPAVVAHRNDTGSAFSGGDLEIGNELLPNHAPLPLPSGIVIDLANSSLAARNDLMFSPRGMVSGPASALGPIYYLLRDVRDVTLGIGPADTTAGVEHRDDLIVAVFPQTGHCACYPVDLTDGDGNGTADDLFRYAKIGSQAGN